MGKYLYVTKTKSSLLHYNKLLSNDIHRLRIADCQLIM